MSSRHSLLPMSLFSFFCGFCGFVPLSQPPGTPQQRGLNHCICLFNRAIWFLTLTPILRLSPILSQACAQGFSYSGGDTPKSLPDHPSGTVPGKCLLSTLLFALANRSTRTIHSGMSSRHSLLPMSLFSFFCGFCGFVPLSQPPGTPQQRGTNRGKVLFCGFRGLANTRH